MKTIFVLAGFDLHSTAASSEFDLLIKGLKSKDYRVVPVDISWLHKMPSKYADEFMSLYKKSKGSYNIVLGNSFGAVIAFITAAKLEPDKLLLCSLSPFFREDNRKEDDGVQWFGKRRLADLRAMSFDQIVTSINNTNIKTTVIYGEKENKTSPTLVNRCKAAAQKIDGAKLKVLLASPHDMSDATYTRELLKMF